MSYAIALAICAVAAAFEGLCAGGNAMAKLLALRQPRWSPSPGAWLLVGLAWYAICYASLVRLLPLWSQHKWPVVLLSALMLANGAANVFQFRLERLDLSFFYLFPYWLLLGAFLWLACPIDTSVCAMFGAYAAYQLYAAAWAYRLWQLNRPGIGADR
jgi:tryptophan-rich sensory protein